MNPKTSDSLQQAYNQQYDERIAEWRALGARFKAKRIIELCRENKYETVLDCGAGDGNLLKELEKDDRFKQFYALEISDSGLAQIHSKKLKRLREAKKFDGYTIPYADNSFDLVYCSHVIEHVEHPRLLLRELKRVGKHLIFEVPLDYYNGIDRQIRIYLDYGHINIFTPSLFKFLLKSEGLGIESEIFSHTEPELVSFNWYRNQGLKKSFQRQFLLRTFKPRKRLKQLIYGKARYAEYGYDAYSCLCNDVGNLKVF